MKFVSLIMSILAVAALSFSCSKENTKVTMTTSMGDIHLELYDNNSPETVKNFLRYADEGFYEGTIFHRVIPDFMIQGGGFTADMMQKKTKSPVQNEAGNRISNTRGTIAMARTQNPHSATSQFFINTKDNPLLDRSRRNYGYCVFGKVTAGMDVIDAISSVSTHEEGPHQNVPDDPVVILEIRRTK